MEPADERPARPAAASTRRRRSTPVRVAVLTVSDTRDEESDTSGDLLADRVTGAGHHLAGKAIVADDIAAIRAAGAGLDRRRARWTPSSPPAAPASPAAT